MEQRYTVEYKNCVIPFVVVRKKVRNINIRIRPDSTILVSANKLVPIEYLEGLVLMKAEWIMKNLEIIDQKINAGSMYRFISGEIIDYLGEQCELQVIETDQVEQAVLENGILKIYVARGSSREYREELVSQWYRKEALPIFNKALERLFPVAAAHGIEKPNLKVRKMKTRWGSCSWGKGKITLNSELLKVPQLCIDYVIMHELAHFRHHGHDQSFYNFMDLVMPDWRARKEMLKKYHL
jgi:hypothetical protein